MLVLLRHQSFWDGPIQQHSFVCKMLHSFYNEHRWFFCFTFIKKRPLIRYDGVMLLDDTVKYDDNDDLFTDWEVDSLAECPTSV